MNRLLDVPWAVNEEAERISTHGGLATMAFCGTVPERREAMRLAAQAQPLARIVRDLCAGRHVDLYDARLTLIAAGVDPAEEKRQTRVSSCAELCWADACRKAGRCDG